ncbi:MAG: hypothetical protein IT437_06495 [Phycisphaerales bacterium]|nr:hypothetical protein [Phycisphaerales bacterium]
MNRKGFALAEAAVLAAVIACITALLLVFGHNQRRQGRLGEDIGKLRRIGALTGQYAADNVDLYWNFSWKKGGTYSQYPDLNNAPTDLQAGADQAVDILRRVAGREDITRITAWFPHVSYAHLPLLDRSKVVPDETFISAADERRLTWSRDPRGFDGGLYAPSPPPDPAAKRWPYSASFTVSTTFFDKSPEGNRVEAASHWQYFVPSNAQLGGKALSGVAFPAQKAFAHDSNARHFGTMQPYCTHDEARLPILFADGSVLVKAAAESNSGWQPNAPASAFPSRFKYAPQPWEPPTLSGLPSEYVRGRFRWTRGFLDGRDLGGPEACTGQPGCP